MGIFDRFSNALRANLNDLLHKVEDKGKLHEQNILDLQESKKKAQSLLVKFLGANKIAMKNKDACDKDLMHLEREASLKEHDEESTNKILVAKQEKARKSAALAAEISANNEAIDAIHSGISALDKKIAQLKASHPHVDATDSTDAFDTYERMEEKIAELEAQGEAFRELMQEEDVKNQALAPGSTKDSLSLDEELEQLRKKMQGL